MRKWEASRSGALRLGAMVAAMALVAACGGSGGSGQTTPTTAGRQALADDQQVLTVATPGDVYITRDRIFLGIWPDNANICETLVGLSPDFQAVPLLATRWTTMANGTVRFELRRDVKFHNGAPLTAAAVEFSLKRVVEKRQALTTQLGPDSVKVVDDYTVDITPTVMNLRLPEQLAHPFFSIIAPGTDPANAPVCTGPFTFGSYTPNDRLVANRNDSYWGTKAKLRQLIFRFVPDQNTRRLALESGDADVVYFLPPQSAADVRSRPGLAVAAQPPGAVVDISLNLRGPEGYTLLGDVDLRRALAMSLDPAGLAQFWQPWAQPVNTVSPPSVLGTAASSAKGVTGNLAQAEALLEQKGWKKGSDGIRAKDGKALALATIAQFDFEPESLQVLQAQARRAGIDLKLEKLPDAAAYSARINSGMWDVDVNYFNQNDANPARIAAQFWSLRANNARVRLTTPGDAYEKLLDEAQVAPDTATAARKAVEAMEILVVQQVAAIPLTNFPQLFGYRANVAGLTPHPSINHQPWTSVYKTT